MKKNLILMLWLSSIILLAGCGGQKDENSNTENKWANVVANNENSNNGNSTNENPAQTHPEWVATSLTNEDLKRIEETTPPISYTYETRDNETNNIISSGNYSVAEGEDPVFMLPGYETMTNREIIKSAIDNNMIYTLAKITLQDDTQLEILYINDPKTLLYRAIELRQGTQNTLYTNFVYTTDLQ